MKVILFLLALLLCTVYGASAGNLYPACGGRIYEKEATSNQKVQLLDLGEHTAIRIDCLAFEVVSVVDASGEDHCLIPHQTNYPYQFTVRATYSNSEGVAVSEVYDIRDVVGGSISGVTLRPQQRSQFSVTFSNLSPHSSCTLKLRALITRTAFEDDTPAASPALVAADPPTIFGSNGAVTYFVMRYPTAAQAAGSAEDLWFLSEDEASSASRCSGTRKYLDTHPQLPSNVQLSEADKSIYAARRYRFGTDDAGIYSLCYVRHGGLSAVAVSWVNVFAGNPSYYDFVQGANEDGSIYGGVPITIKFYGYDLDTRPDGDRAKFVVDTDSCETGAPAAGVPLATDLGPADDYGPNTTYTLWSFTIKYGGIFRVCYRRKQANGWTEVPSIDEVGPGAQPTTPPEELAPTPTDPVTKKACAVAPASTAEDPWKQYAGVRVTLSTKQTPSNMRRDLADAICVPRGAVAVERVTRASNGNAVLYISIDCEGVVADGESAACSTTERYNYLAHLARTNASELAHHGVAQWEVLTGILIGDDTAKEVTVVSKGGVFMICLTVVGAAVGLAYAKVKYDERREYFVQFGMDDGDLEDMYETGAIPFSMGGESEDVYGYGYHGDGNGDENGAGGRGSGRGGGRAASHIGDALIEIEE